MGARWSQAAAHGLLAGPLLGFTVCLIPGPAQAQADPTDTPLSACLTRAAATLPEAPRAALERINGVSRRLLAVSGYLRSQDLSERWSWDTARIRAYEATPEKQAAQAELAKVQAAFAQTNPGFALRINTQVRSLNVQLDHWNANASVQAAATALASPAEAACRASPDTFTAWLRGWRPPVSPSVAVPGLSPHGQGRAYDFQVVTVDGVLVAGTDTRRIDADWIAGGWDRKLAAAVASGSPQFHGPLVSPREPWHFSYEP
jgi:hypothetical protein